MKRRLFFPAAASAVALLGVAAMAQPPADTVVTSSATVTLNGRTITVEGEKVTIDGRVVTATPDMKSKKAPVVTKAVCVLMPVGDSKVSGVLHFEQAGDSVKVTGEVKGLEPGEHGFHVHQFGDLTDMETGKSAGGHMDVGEHKHGKPSDKERHTGDLGNITADENGVAKVEMTDSVISLNGAHSIVGRGFIVHADPDDFGQPTGNAGARVAIGAIGVAQDGLK
ncbi:superoxide dismutase family protein [Alienimonas chondri]|uniref:Superoxide dismutase copper/zinc binding domain-containing protein n=1 Tax=Alienimonas chondri TaxID=2681879 RepID=A0ABX1VJJ5_9PLAN|nr:superoxide dismutase family protein [Alienimonas chondri]NNJ27919.1 hypothetical protein [Alienimonas chondri]